MVQDRQEATDLAQIWGHYPSGAHVAFDARKPGQFNFDGSGGNSAKYSMDTGDESAMSISNGVDKPWAYDTFHVVGASFDSDVSMAGQSLGVLSTLTSHRFGGDIGEIMIFDRELSDAEKTLVKLYLLKRWGDDIDTSPPGEVSNLQASSNALGLSLSWSAAPGSTTGYGLPIGRVVRLLLIAGTEYLKPQRRRVIRSLRPRQRRLTVFASVLRIFLPPSMRLSIRGSDDFCDNRG